MLSIESVQQLLEPLFPGLMGLRVVELAPERVVGELVVRPDLCTAVIGMENTTEIPVDATSARLDRYVSDHLPELSRAVVSVLLPMENHSRDTACVHGRCFSSREAATPWLDQYSKAQNVEVEILPVREAFESGRRHVQRFHLN